MSKTLFDATARGTASVLMVIAGLLAPEGAHAVFPKPTEYSVNLNSGGPCVWDEAQVCLWRRSPLDACVAALPGSANVNVQPIDHVGRYPCTSDNPFGVPCDNTNNNCPTAFSAAPTLRCPANSGDGGATCDCRPDLNQANDTCSGGGNNGPRCKGGPCPVGNPVNPGNGNKYQRHEVYQGLHGFEFVFTYNAFDDFPSRIGRNWRDNFNRQVLEDGADVQVYRPDGKTFRYALSAGLWTPTANVIDKLTELKDGGGNRTGWTLDVGEGDELETYDAAGKLLTIQSRAGLTQTLTYSDGTGGANGGFYLDFNTGNPTKVVLPAGLLIRVHDHFGRTLVFGWLFGNRIIRVTDPAGNLYRFGYQNGERLSYMRHPDKLLRSYLYNEQAHTGGLSLPNAITAVNDENGKRFATYKYNAEFRNTLTEHAGGVERYTSTYSGSSTTVTSPLGAVRT